MKSKVAKLGTIYPYHLKFQVINEAKMKFETVGTCIDVPNPAVKMFLQLEQKYPKHTIFVIDSFGERCPAEVRYAKYL